MRFFVIHGVHGGSGPKVGVGDMVPGDSFTIFIFQKNAPGVAVKLMRIVFIIGRHMQTGQVFYKPCCFVSFKSVGRTLRYGIYRSAYDAVNFKKIISIIFDE